MTETTRFEFVNIGDQRALEPQHYNAFQAKVDSNLPENKADFAAVGAGVAQTFDYPVAVRRARLTLTDATVTILEANDYGSLELCTLPDKNIIVLACEADLSIVKDNTTNGVVAATDLDVAIGTAAASNATLSSTMVNVLAKQDVDTDAVTVTMQAHSLASTPVLLGIVDAATNKLYLNVAASITADDGVTVSGTIDVFFIDLGNVTS
ncbi:MAG: hypothetical protein HC888_04640 [Candidatus Competibacteraceae bacterium]|nr:hypothetical protein [Candidatus Competibacteraceae bacterium]